MADMLTELQAIIHDRQQNPKPGSYTNQLLDEGISRVAQKVGEEAVEVVVATLSQPRELQIGELSDLFYHTLVLMAHQGITLDDVYAELQRRHNIRKETPLD
jgi:phosphoribosyl-ATP pyrophosphohydrolase/phosphoribosyl-AMP cyclohydrolase